jgi:ribonuclease P protein component
MAVALGRLKARPDFLRVAAASRKCVTPGLILQVAPAPPGAADGTEEDAEPRLGFTASRKVGTAVERNRARRRLRAAAHEVMETHARAGRDYVLIARRGTLARPFASLLQDLEHALKTLKSFRDDRNPTLPPRAARRHVGRS